MEDELKNSYDEVITANVSHVPCARCFGMPRLQAKCTRCGGSGSSKESRNCTLTRWDLIRLNIDTVSWMKEQGML